MKILQIFNRYAYMGGEEIAVTQISEELSAHHDFRSITLDSREWASRTDWLSRMRQFFSMAWNPASIRMAREQIKEFQPDVVLLHNIMPIGSAWLYVYLTRCGVPVIQFIHNFRPFSVNGYCWGKGKLLPQGLEKNFFPEILAASWQDSYVKTAWYGLLIWLLHQVRVFERIDGWIAISQFMKNSFVQGGIEEDRIRVISHGWQLQCSDDELQRLGQDEHQPVFLFLGRLTEEKGLRVLLDAWAVVEDASPTGNLIIAGDGPLADEVKMRCDQMQRASYVGFQSGEDKRQLLRNCTALVVPSIWWEPLGLVLYEAYDFGKPVLAARSGGIVDHVEDGVTGWLHEPGNVAMLAGHMREAIADPRAGQKRGANGRRLLLHRGTRAWIADFNAFAREVIAAKLLQNDHGRLRRSPGPQIPAESRGLPLRVQVYLADQNPMLGRSLGISRMTQVILQELATRPDLYLSGISSRSSIQMPDGAHSMMVPWSTRGMVRRIVTDHLHPLWGIRTRPDIWYFPKGFLPRLHQLCSPSVVTIHDTIIQYCSDHYPKWRTETEYFYWANMLKHTLRHANGILTVSESAKAQIVTFMRRHGIPEKEIHVTYEPCLFEGLPQPTNPVKADYVLHLGSREPHKRTAWLIELWVRESATRRNLPALHVVGKLPPEVEDLALNEPGIVCLPFLNDDALRSQFSSAKALIFPSEIEGFGLPAIEAYYMGTPVCYTLGTSIEEVLEVATHRGGFELEQPDSLFSALDDVMTMNHDEIRECGLMLRETYAAKKVAGRMLKAFRELVAETE